MRVVTGLGVSVPSVSLLTRMIGGSQNLEFPRGLVDANCHREANKQRNAITPWICSAYPDRTLAHLRLENGSLYHT